MQQGVQVILDILQAGQAAVIQRADVDGQIADLLVDVALELLQERGLELKVSPAARRHLAEQGFDPVFGARPLKRVIQRELQDPLALALLQGEFGAGDMVQADLSGAKLDFTRLEWLNQAA